MRYAEANFGFCKGHSQHQAIKYVQGIVQEGYEWCESIDLASFFDEIPHDLIFKLIRRRIADEKLLTPIARALKAGVLIDGKIINCDKGCLQGAPLSPMFSKEGLDIFSQFYFFQPLNVSSVADRRGAYLAGTARYVGRR